MTRQEANREIVRRLSNWVEIYPDLRFSQVLYGAGVVKDHPVGINGWADDFYLESTELLKRMDDE